MGHGVRSPAAGALSLVHDRERLAPRLAALQRVSRPPTFPLIAAILGLFLGSGAVGVAMAGALAPGSRLAEAVSLFALPFAFAVGLQAWYGLALLSLVPRLVRWLVGGCVPALPGAFVFVPLSSGAGALAGIVSELASTTHPAWLVALAYWLAGTLHGLIAWRLARRGILIPPQTV